MLICVNTHFDFDVSVQVDSAKLIVDRLSYLPLDVPVILMGDFNALPLSPCHNIFTGKGQKRASMEGFFKNAFKKPFPGTQHGFSGNLDGDHIDWILYRGKIEIKDILVVHGTIDGRYPSDHFPIYATFEEKKNGLR